MTPKVFAAKWRKASALSDRGASQSHFLDVCALVGEPSPTEADPLGAWFAFEKGVPTSDGKRGFADVWRKGCFGWEY